MKHLAIILEESSRVGQDIKSLVKDEEELLKRQYHG